MGCAKLRFCGKFEFRYESVKNQFSFFCCCLQFDDCMHYKNQKKLINIMFLNKRKSNWDKYFTPG